MSNTCACYWRSHLNCGFPSYISVVGRSSPGPTPTVQPHELHLWSIDWFHRIPATSTTDPTAWHSERIDSPRLVTVNRTSAPSPRVEIDLRDPAATILANRTTTATRTRPSTLTTLTLCCQPKLPSLAFSAIHVADGNPLLFQYWQHELTSIIIAQLRQISAISGNTWPSYWWFNRFPACFSAPSLKPFCQRRRLNRTCTKFVLDRGYNYTIIDASQVCFRFQIFCSISKLWRLKGDGV